MANRNLAQIPINAEPQASDWLLGATAISPTVFQRFPVGALPGNDGGGLTWSAITDNTTATAGNGYYLNPSTTLTLTLPPSPAIGDQVGFALVGGTLAIIACNGSKMGGYANDRIIKNTFTPAAITLLYTGSAKGWEANVNLNSEFIRAKFWDKFSHYWRFDFDVKQTPDLVGDYPLYGGGGAKYLRKQGQNVGAYFQGSTYWLSSDNNTAALEINTDYSVIVGATNTEALADSTFISCLIYNPPRGWQLDFSWGYARFLWFEPGANVNWINCQQTIGQKQLYHAQFTLSNYEWKFLRSDNTYNSFLASTAPDTAGDIGLNINRRRSGDLESAGICYFIGIARNTFTLEEVLEIKNNNEFILMT